MTALLLAVLTASLFGSLHCAGMCGPFVAFSTLRVKDRQAHTSGSSSLQIYYHGGRLVSYVALGVAAGALGAALNLGTTILGLGRWAGILAGAMLVVMGLARLIPLIGLRFAAPLAERWLRPIIARGQAAASRMDPPRRALTIGLLTTLLPCGWLYAFVAVAAGTGHGFRGATVMLTFWLGTVPILAGIGAGFGAVLLRTRRSFQAITAIIVVGLGLHGIVGRWGLPSSVVATPAKTMEAAAERVSAILNHGGAKCHCQH